MCLSGAHKGADEEDASAEAAEGHLEGWKPANKTSWLAISVSLLLGKGSMD